MVLLTLQELHYELSDFCGCTAVLLHTTRGLVTLRPRRRHVLEIAGMVIHIVGSERTSLKQIPLFTRGKVESGRKLVHMSLTTLDKVLCASTWKTTKVSYTDRSCWLRRSPALVHKTLPSLWSLRGDIQPDVVCCETALRSLSDTVSGTNVVAKSYGWFRYDREEDAVFREVELEGRRQEEPCLARPVTARLC